MSCTSTGREKRTWKGEKNGSGSENMQRDVSGCLHVITFSQRNAECGVKIGKVCECKKLVVWRVGMSNYLEDAACEVSEEKMLLLN